MSLFPSSSISVKKCLALICLLSLSLAVLLACSGPNSALVDYEVSPLQRTHAEMLIRQSDDVSPDKPVLQICDRAPYPEPVQEQDWNRTASRLAASLLTPRHVVSDVLTTGQSDPIIEGKFGHGPMVKDLEHEFVEIWYDDCSGQYQKLATVETDGQGWISHPWDRHQLPDYGLYQLYFRVVADQTYALSTLRVLPEGTQLVVFDIDGTLTTGNREVFKDWVADAGRVVGIDDYVPKLRAGAATLTRKRAWDQGYVPIYLTGRFYWMYHRTRSWMHSLGIAPGHLEMTPGWGEWWPTNDGIGQFKAQFLEGLRDDGFHIAVMYGNASTDAWAYETTYDQASDIYMFDGNGNRDDTIQLRRNYIDHLIELRDREIGTVEQPFIYPQF